MGIHGISLTGADRRCILVGLELGSTNELSNQILFNTKPSAGSVKPWSSVENGRNCREVN